MLGVKMAPVDRRVPVTVLTGFLGAGKTTLLNRILQENHGEKIAVIENEFGEISIDNDLVVGVEEEIFEMNNGCLCCTVRGDLIRTLNDLSKRRQKFNKILIETTGLADPGPVAQTFFLDEKISDAYRIDAIITLVDAKHIALHLGDAPEAAQQIAFADVLILNKSDLVSPEELDALETRIRKINALCKIVRTTKADVPVSQLLNLKSFNPSDKFEIIALEASTEEHHHHEHDHECGPDCDHDHDHEHHHHEGEHHHHHDESVSSVGIEVVGECDPNRLNQWMGELLQYRGEDIFRMKGVLALKGQPVRFVFQGVHMMFDGVPDRPWKLGEEKKNRLVFIGRNLNREALNEGFRSCLIGK